MSKSTTNTTATTSSLMRIDGFAVPASKLKSINNSKSTLSTTSKGLSINSANSNSNSNKSNKLGFLKSLFHHSNNPNSNGSVLPSYPIDYYTIEQVAIHNTVTDCWLIIHGRVYNLTSYGKLHPGGSKLLFRNAGSDSTGDFEAMHHSAKAYNILESYWIGDLVSTPPRLNPPTNLGQALKQNTLFVNPPAAMEDNTVSNKSAAAVGAGESINIVNNTSTGGFSINLITPTDLPNEVINNNNQSDTAAADAPGTGRIFTLVAIQQITADSKLFTFQDQLIQSNSASVSNNYQPFIIPTGHHIVIQYTDNNTKQLIKRQYTPINTANNGTIELLVRIYNSGLVSQYLNQLQLLNNITIYGPYGSLDWNNHSININPSNTINTINNNRNLLLIAAGTGISPIYQLLQRLINTNNNIANINTNTTIHLLYSNRTESDILLKSELDQLLIKYNFNTNSHSRNNKFNITHILSKSTNNTTNNSVLGRINKDIINNIISTGFTNNNNTTINNNDLHSFICGSVEFNLTINSILLELGIKSIHLF